jgi:hypothetical protein
VQLHLCLIRIITLEQDQHLDHLSHSINRQHHISLQINDELDVHHGLLQDLDADIDRTQSRLGKARKKLDRVARGVKNNGWCLACCYGLHTAKTGFFYRFGGCDWGVDFYSPHPYYPVQDMTDKSCLDILHVLFIFGKWNLLFCHLASPSLASLCFITRRPLLSPFHSRCIISLSSRRHSMCLPGSSVTILSGTLEPFP